MAESNKQPDALVRRLAAEFSDSPDPEKSAALAAFAVLPNSGAAAVMASHGKTLNCGNDEANALVAELDSGSKELHAGDMNRAEAMLYAQANALQAIFVDLAARSTRQDRWEHWEAYLRMALKAQNQCRATLESLSAIKNPPLVFARQANINNGGQQQVNNSAAAAPSPSRAERPTTAKTELLEAQHGQRLDCRKARSAGRFDPQLEAVGKIHRAKNP